MKPRCPEILQTKRGQLLILALCLQNIDNQYLLPTFLSRCSPFLHKRTIIRTRIETPMLEYFKLEYFIFFPGIMTVRYRLVGVFTD